MLIMRRKKLASLFLEKIIEKINEIYPCYYEEVPSSASFPFCVIPTININDLNMGKTIMFTIEIYNNKLSKIISEDIMQNLEKQLDRYHYIDDTIAFHIGWDNSRSVKSIEQDLIIKEVSLTARIFNIGG